MDFLTFLIVLTGIVVGGILLFQAYHYILRKRSAKMMSQAELNEQIRRVQLVDTREIDEHEAKHILGSRNIPLTQFKMRAKELRKDQRIVLYDDVLSRSSRAAHILKKEQYEDVYILEDPFEEWTGRVKSNR